MKVKELFENDKINLDDDEETIRECFRYCVSPDPSEFLTKTSLQVTRRKS